MHIFAHLKYSNVKSSQKKTTMQKCIKLHLKCHLGPENVSILFYLYLGQKKGEGSLESFKTIFPKPEKKRKS